jgi:hypothetical protein
VVLRHIYTDLKKAGYAVDASRVSKPQIISEHHVIICERYRRYLSGLRYSDSTIATYLHGIQSYGFFLKDKKVDERV